MDTKTRDDIIKIVDFYRTNLEVTGNYDIRQHNVVWTAKIPGINIRTKMGAILPAEFTGTSHASAIESLYRNIKSGENLVKFIKHTDSQLVFQLD